MRPLLIATILTLAASCGPPPLDADSAAAALEGGSALARDPRG